jgi:putative FmdB family regulatory protein
MPTYEYACLSCGTHVEVYQRFSEDALTVCGVCGGPLRKVFHPAGILFKGSGFYATDSRASASKGPSSNGDKGDRGGPASGEKAGSKTGSGSKGGESSDRTGSKGGGESSDGSGKKSERSSQRGSSAAKEKSA